MTPVTVVMSALVDDVAVVDEGLPVCVVTSPCVVVV